MPRPTKLVPETQQTIVNAIQAGATYRSAAEASGISYDTFNNWMKAGQSGGDAEYVQFFEAVQRANAMARIILLSRIQTASTPHDITTTRRTVLPNGGVKEETTTTRDWDWKAAAWILERRFPDEYGQQLAMHFSKMSDDELRAYIATHVGALEIGNDQIGDAIAGRISGSGVGDLGSGEPPKLDARPADGNGKDSA